MSLLFSLDKNNLHHAYLIEGAREEVVAELLEFFKNMGINTTGNADLCQISLDVFKIDDARNLKSLSTEKSFSGTKKIFIISANIFLLEAQNSLLKLFEEPIEGTHFFIITPEASGLLKTLASRFYFISSKSKKDAEMRHAEEFVKMSLKNRLDFIKELLAQPEDEDSEVVVLDSNRAKAMRFLNALEETFHKKILSKPDINKTNTGFFNHFFKVREFIRMPGSSPKTLMESVALAVPDSLK